MTAVEWLVQQINNGKIEIIYSDKIHSIKCLPEFVQQALELEKEQIIDAAANHCYPTCELARVDAEQYYSETYKKENT